MSSPVICDDLDRTTPAETTAALARQAAASRRPSQLGGAETVQVDG